MEKCDEANCCIFRVCVLVEHIKRRGKSSVKMLKVFQCQKLQVVTKGMFSTLNLIMFGAIIFSWDVSFYIWVRTAPLVQTCGPKSDTQEGSKTVASQL